MFNKTVIHDIAMLCLKDCGIKEPIELAKLYKQVYTQINNELNKTEIEEEYVGMFGNERSSVQK